MGDPLRFRTDEAHDEPAVTLDTFLDDNRMPMRSALKPAMTRVH